MDREVECEYKLQMRTGLRSRSGTVEQVTAKSALVRSFVPVDAPRCDEAWRAR